MKFENLAILRVTTENYTEIDIYVDDIIEISGERFDIVGKVISFSDKNVSVTIDSISDYLEIPFKEIISIIKNGENA